MRIALIADVHSNLAALEAALKAIKKHEPDMILSLGDQVNLGPCPREVLALLRAERVHCLHGNHERYILSAMAGNPGYAGANFDVVRWGASMLSAQEITFPMTYELDGVTFCHALPQDDRFPVFDPQRAIPMLRDMHIDKPTHIICGHGHNPTHIRMDNLTIDSIGSVGCMDDGVPGTAPYAMLTLEKDAAALRPYYVPYDTGLLRAQFISSGMAEACPIMAHIVCLQMMHNQDYLVRFVAGAQAISRARGETQISEQSWAEMDAQFPWPDGANTTEFWK
ncbi:MAG: metallophosphoesterase [Clostridia bacterium]|nr:metallophosphoesterase [Clostridia bacterium]